jgi:pseudouridine synthase
MIDRRGRGSRIFNKRSESGTNNNHSTSGFRARRRLNADDSGVSGFRARRRLNADDSGVSGLRARRRLNADDSGVSDLRARRRLNADDSGVSDLRARRRLNADNKRGDSIYNRNMNSFRPRGKQTIQNQHFKYRNRNIPQDNHLQPMPAVVRINRLIAASGICARREADELILQGRVTVNGEVVTELGTRVNQFEDVVKVDGNKIQPGKPVYILLNKPKNCITTTGDPEGRLTVMDLVKGATQERIFPVGRLDRNTTGLLLMTNDGELAEKLSHPSHQVRKVYVARLDRKFEEADLQKLLTGFELEDGFAKADKAARIENGGPDEVGIEVHSGRNRLVRRMFEHLGYEVKALDRVIYAGLTKKWLPRGRWRFLDEKEIAYLKMI